MDRRGWEGWDPWQSPAQHQVLQPRVPHRDIWGHCRDSQLRARDFHPQSEICSVLACIPEEQLLSRANDEGNSLGSFLPPGTLRGHCVCPGQPGVSSQHLPRASRFLSGPLPFPEPPLAAAAPLGEAREPGRKGSCPGLGWDVFLPAWSLGFTRLRAWNKTHPLAREPRASSAPSGTTECQGSLEDGAGPDPAPDPAWAPRAALTSLGCPDSHGAVPHSAKVQGWARGGRAHPHLPGDWCDHKRARESHCNPGTSSPPPHSLQDTAGGKG